MAASKKTLCPPLLGPVDFLRAVVAEFCYGGDKILPPRWQFFISANAPRAKPDIKARGRCIGLTILEDYAKAGLFKKRGEAAPKVILRPQIFIDHIQRTTTAKPDDRFWANLSIGQGCPACAPRILRQKFFYRLFCEAKKKDLSLSELHTEWLHCVCVVLILLSRLNESKQ